MKYPQRNSFEMQAHDAQFEKKTKSLLELINEPLYRADGKLNI